MAILSKYKLEKYQFGIHVQKGRQLYGMSGKIIYNGRWKLGRDDQIIIVEMNEVIAEREALFYLEVNTHNNIIRTLGYVENVDNLTILIQQFAAQGDLADMLMDNQFVVSQSILIEMFAQIADAMSFVASKKIIHGDLGCRNVLVFQVDSDRPKNNLVKITDFGLARWIDRPPTNEDASIIPIRYCAPEILRNNHHSSYSEKSDVYSMGALIWEALSNGEMPYSSVSKDDDVKQMKLENKRLLRPTPCDRQLWVLMKECWHSEPQQRPTFEKINDRLSNMTVSEVPDDGRSISLNESPKHYDYRLNVNVRVNDLQHGTFGKNIYEAEWISEEEEGPIVLIEKNEEPSESESLFYALFKHHHHIIHTFGFVGNDRGSIMILQERAPHANLQTLLESGQFNPSPQVLVEIFLQIIDAMIDITDQGLVHGDLRCENVLVFDMHPSDPKRNLVKLSNFTLAHPNDPSLVDDRRLVIPVRYCALEILRSAGRSNYSEYSDVYSMGVLMWQACSKGKLPYGSSITNGEVRQRKLNNEILPKPTLCHKNIWYMMENCWRNEPTIRYDFKEMKQWFSKDIFESTETYQYELNVNVSQKGPLNGNDGRFYEADWIPKKEPRIILYVLDDDERGEREGLFYMKLNSPHHIIQTFGFVKNDLHSVMLLQERAPHGNLQRLLQNGQFHPSSKVLVTLFLQIVNAMIYITSQNIIHGDLRCGNVLVFEMDSSESTRNVVKLTNFSLSRTKDEVISEKRLPDGSVRYRAPEIVRSGDGSNYSELSDVYSMGVLMWECLSKGEVPYGARTSDGDVRQRRLNDEKLPRPKECRNEIWEIVTECLLSQPESRYSFTGIKIRLSNIPAESIPLKHCVRCKNDIPEDEMDNHKKLCSRKRSVDGRTTESPIYFTRCNYCAERCLGSELEDHQRSCLYNPASSIDIGPILLIPCDYCHENCHDNEIIAHQRSCAARATPPLDHESLRLSPCRYCEKIYQDSEIADHMKSCLSRPKTPVLQRGCKYCNDQYSLVEIEHHEKTCRSGFKTPSSPPSSQPPPKPLPPVSQPRPKPDPGRRCTYCSQQHSLATISAHENSCPLKPKSFTERLFSWVCCCCAKD